jgi:hypothetical protein
MDAPDRGRIVCAGYVRIKRPQELGASVTDMVWTE